MTAAPSEGSDATHSAHGSVVELRVNGALEKIPILQSDTLLQALRARLGLTGPKYGCGIGYCGACTVLIDGDVAHSCCILAGTMGGRDITTVEGLGEPDHLDPVQAAMLQEGALQCGYCTPGIVTTLRGLLDQQSDPDETIVREWLGGNICRCTGFESIVRAALRCTATSPGASTSGSDG